MSLRFGMSMRWWLALAFAAIASLTALSVAEVFNNRAEHALRDQGENLVIGQSVSAAHAVGVALRAGDRKTVASIAARRPYSMWVFGRHGALLTSEVSRGVNFARVPQGLVALRTTVAQGRYVQRFNRGKTYVVGVRLRDRGGVVVTFAQRPELQAELGIVHDQILRSALFAVLIGAVVGLLVATLIARRLGRIARAAAAIEAGAFDKPLRPRFKDELGSLAETIDQMRIRLRESFRELEAQRDRLRQLLEGLHEGVIALDRELRIVFWNGSARALFQDHALEGGEPLPEPWLGFPLRTFAAGLFDGTTVLQARVVADDRIYALTGIPARPGTSDAILVVSDISERERRERAEREFVANAAHELGTPLTAIRASLEVLQGGAKDDALERDRFLSLIERQTLRLSRLRRALLALARAQTRHEPLQLESVPLVELLQRVADEVGPLGSGTEIVVEADEETTAFAHPELLEQVVFNLVENVLRHAGASEIELVASRFDTGLVAIEVRDDGKGIAAGERERLFDRFYRGSTESEDGFGLGLAIVHEAVRALGGTIRINSRPGGGTIVSVVLTAARVPVA